LYEPLSPAQPGGSVGRDRDRPSTVSGQRDGLLNLLDNCSELLSSLRASCCPSTNADPDEDRKNQQKYQHKCQEDQDW
jgi:hypothetical protein